MNYWNLFDRSNIVKLFTERYREILYDTAGNSKEGFCDDDEIPYDIVQKMKDYLCYGVRYEK